MCCRGESLAGVRFHPTQFGAAFGDSRTGLVTNPALSVVWVRQIPLHPDRSFQVASPRVSRNQQEATPFCDQEDDLKTQRSFGHEAKRQWRGCWQPALSRHVLPHARMLSPPLSGWVCAPIRLYVI